MSSKFAEPKTPLKKFSWFKLNSWYALSAILVAISITAVVMTSIHATSAAFANEFLEDEIEETAGEESKADVAIQWPHCVLNIDDLKPRPLAEAVAVFNKEATTSPIGQRQRPITDMETMAAIDESLELKHVDEKIKVVLRKIAESGTLPANAYFRRFTRFDDGEKFNGVWWVRLVLETENSPVYSVPIRTAHVFSRPYSQMERQQNAEEGLMLINRFSSYFAELPSIKLLDELPKDASDRLIDQVSKAIEAKDLDTLKEFFAWDGVSDSTRAFVENELRSLTETKVHSITIRPQNLEGELIHWSAWQRYKPNLEIIGYLDIVHDANEKSGRKLTLSLEMGIHGDEFKLVNYIGDGKANPPKRLEKPMSIRGHFEPLPDSTHFLTTTITNPGNLLSAHLANEEIWLRGLDVRKKPVDADELNYRIEDEKSDRLKAMFKKLRVKPNLQPSSHARDLPDLYRADPENPGRYIPRPGILIVHYNIGLEQTNDMEHIWLKYLPHTNRYYVEQRFHRNDPYHDRVFGPFTGNPYEQLPELEEEVWTNLRAGNSNGQIMIHRMMEVEEADLTRRVVELFDRVMGLDFEINFRNDLYKSINATLDSHDDQLDAMPIRETVASIRERLGTFFVEVEKLRIEHPLASYSPASESSMKVPNEFADELWGEPMNGLRAALVPETMEFQLLKTVKATLVVENIGREDVRLSTSDNDGQIYPDVTYKREHVNLDYLFSRFFRIQTTELHVLKPGEKIALGEAKLRPFRKGQHVDDDSTLSDYGLAKIPLSGKMLESTGLRADYTLHIGASDLWRREEDGSMKIYFPAKGEWKGALKTGGFAIEFKDD